METILQHFRKDEQPFIEMAIGWIREVEDTYAPKLTGFLDPRQQFIVESLASGSDLQVDSNGAFPEAERQRMLIYPDYYVPEQVDYQIAVFNVKYASKFLKLEHKDILGSMMSLGIDRSKFGDIRVGEEEVQFAVADELKDYMTANFTSIGKAKVTVEENTRPEEWIHFDRYLDGGNAHRQFDAARCRRCCTYKLFHDKKQQRSFTVKK